MDRTLVSLIAIVFIVMLWMNAWNEGLDFRSFMSNALITAFIVLVVKSYTSSGAKKDS